MAFCPDLPGDRRGGFALSEHLDEDGAGTLLLEKRGYVLIVTLNRPEARNALDWVTMHALGAAVLEAEADPEVRVMVLTGTGDRAFCSGRDLREVAGAQDSPGADPGHMPAFRRLFDGEVALPVIGAANGTAVAGGFELLLGCDMIVAAAHARFGLPEVKRGLFPGGSGTFLGTRIPLSVALELLLTGATIDADRAFALGLVNSVVPAGEVLDAALSLAEQVAVNGPLAVAAAKELGRLAVVDHARAKARLAELTTQVFSSQDAREGATAFLERRSPRWQGR